MHPGSRRPLFRFHLHWRFVELLATNPAEAAQPHLIPRAAARGRIACLGLVFVSPWSVECVELAQQQQHRWLPLGNASLSDVRLRQLGPVIAAN